ncbi:hypothetical protein [Noviherbaspirillum aerium]|uniref:hypothetical protein n=1 Tax=Noviherbaspirillum aerium TaxID=2588497 RepID=UPI00124BF772|nr:hypothetical protein [Noviherbaspirillum aerium]
MDIEFGHLDGIDTQGTGWFLGFSDWVRDSSNEAGGLRYMPSDRRSHTLAMKWMRHAAGDPRGSGKPVSEGRTISILVGMPGRFRLQFSEYPDFPEESIAEYLLETNGHFCLWGEGIHHRYTVEEGCTILTLRWIPEQPSPTA